MRSSTIERVKFGNTERFKKTLETTSQEATLKLKLMSSDRTGRNLVITILEQAEDAIHSSGRSCDFEEDRSFGSDSDESEDSDVSFATWRVRDAAEMGFDEVEELEFVRNEPEQYIIQKVGAKVKKLEQLRDGCRYVGGSDSAQTIAKVNDGLADVGRHLALMKELKSDRAECYKCARAHLDRSQKAIGEADEALAHALMEACWSNTPYGPRYYTLCLSFSIYLYVFPGFVVSAYLRRSYDRPIYPADRLFPPSVVPLPLRPTEIYIYLQDSMSSGNSLLNVPSFPEASQLSGQDTWRAFKDRVELNVQVRGLNGYLDGSIPKPTSATYIYTAQTASPVDSQSPSPGEWNQRERMVASIIYLNCTDPIGIGIERGDTAHKTWQYLTKKYESRDEQRIHIADTTLREHKFNPDTTTMEEHEKRMKNLLKALHNLGGTCNDYQFRMIVIASMPDTWKDYVLNVPGLFSAEAFTYLHRLYLDKVGRARDGDDDYIKKRVAALVAQHLATQAASSSSLSPKRERPICTNPLCPTKIGHTIDRCWARGGGAEGKAPKSWKDKYGTKASVVDTSSPIDVYVGSAHSDDGSLMPF
ncbi:hypothetical protein BT96DRAFT_1048017 [Gymnopus androsaceus JB14]|uniref:Uncharacterized protein n=1 Tax=Gymnopus androsaceus JB14 TaxID=1447944 RepID=A0A6A4I836_9AGAR|nr:hypothetical protein BT96DRAFT_1048017 [Gymnopus androsaceus JB14]